MKQTAKLAMRSQKQKDKAFAQNMIKNLENTPAPLAPPTTSDAVSAQGTAHQLSERLRSQIAGTMLSSNGASVEVPPPSVSDRPDDAKDDGVAADDDDDDDDDDDEWPVPLLAITISVGLALATGVALAWTRRRAR